MVYWSKALFAIQKTSVRSERLEVMGLFPIHDRGSRGPSPGRRSPHSALEQNLSKFGLLKDKSRIVARLLKEINIAIEGKPNY